MSNVISLPSCVSDELRKVILLHRAQHLYPNCSIESVVSILLPRMQGPWNTAELAAEGSLAVNWWKHSLTGEERVQKTLEFIQAATGLQRHERS